MNTRYLLVHSKYGIFLGAYMGYSYWSKMETGNQTVAVTFISKHELTNFVNDMLMYPEGVYDIVEIKIKDTKYATIEECIAAGQEGWFSSSCTYDYDPRNTLH